MISNLNPEGVISISPRDRRLFSYLFENKGASFQQINRDIFPNLSKGIVSRRMTKLRMHGFIQKKVAVGDRGLIHWFSVTPDGLKFSDDYDLERLNRKQFESDVVEHDEVLVDVRSAFRQFGTVQKHVTENQLQSLEQFTHDKGFQPFIMLRSDGVVEIKVGNNSGLLAVEFEKKQKEVARYDAKVSQYYICTGVLGILFISQTPAIERSVKEAEGRIRGKAHPKFYFAQLEDVISGAKKVQFTSCQGEIIELKK